MPNKIFPMIDLAPLVAEGFLEAVEALSGDILHRTSEENAVQKEALRTKYGQVTDEVERANLALTVPQLFSASEAI